jgi:hypothetical protein
MFKLLVDTCVWLDVAKDHQQQATLGVLEELVRQGQVSLIVPDIVRNEFARNKARIVHDSQQSLSSVLKRAKEVVNQFGDSKRKRVVLEQLNEVDYKLPSLGESAAESIGRVEKLLANAPPLEVSDVAKLRATGRAIAKKAPFHREKSRMADALLIETYSEVIATKSAGVRFAFVTHNVKDFSQPNGDHRLPHPDFAAYFSRIKSLYFINLAEVLKRLNPGMVTDYMIEHEWVEEPRRLSEIVKAIDELTDKVWYDRHQMLRRMVESGKTNIVDKETAPVKGDTHRPIQKNIWEGAKKAARQVEKRYGRNNLGPWTDMEWGMINGKLSALRWVLGDEWDMLDT